MGRLVMVLALAIAVLLAACGAEGDEGGREQDLSEESAAAGKGARETRTSMGLVAPFATPRPAATAAPGAFLSFTGAEAGGAPQLGSGALETAQRKVISSASISIEVETVQPAISEVRVIAESLGGFVEQLTSSGGPERQRASMTVRVPQAQFFPALERIEALGEVQDRNLGSEDVSEQFIDLEARLRSSLREEQSLLSLLEKTATVSEVLAIERELTRVRSEIERFQGQLNFLERRVDLATISVSLFPPEEKSPEPPSAFVVIDVPDVGRAVAEVKGLAATIGGVVDGVFLSQRNGDEEASLSLRVFSADFQRVMDAVEAQGKVRSKDVQEGTAPAGGSLDRAEEPDAAIELSLVAQEESSNTALIAAIGGTIGALLLVAAMTALYLWAYRAGRLRARAG